MTDDAMLEDWQKHISDTHVERQGFAICGAQLGALEWAFTGIDHAFLSVQQGGWTQPAPCCAAVVVATFAEAGSK